MKKLLPVLLVLIGLGSGMGAGFFLRPQPEDHALANPCGEPGVDAMTAEETGQNEPASDEAQTTQEYVKLNNQFVVPVVTNDLVDALVVMSLSVEIAEGQTEAVYKREPKLRDSFLQVLFDHANMGGFAGEFTNANNMDVLRAALTETAQGVLGGAVSGVLITDIARQDI